jgi:hypothetical protein
VLVGQAIAEQRFGQMHFPHTKMRHPAGVVEKCREAFDSAIVPWSGVLKQYRNNIEEDGLLAHVTIFQRALRASDIACRRAQSRRLCTKPRHCGLYRFDIPPANGCQF